METVTLPRTRKVLVLTGTALLAAGAALLGAALFVLFPWTSGHPVPRTAAAQDASAMLTELRTAFEDRLGPPLSGSWRLRLPEDHGAHPEANAETWAVFAHLRDAEGRPVSAILTLSRFGVAAEHRDADTPWAPHAAWLGQAALAQPDPRAEERLSRGMGAAGADALSGAVWLDDWVLQHPTDAGTGPLSLQARIEGHPLDLALRPVKAPIAPGEVTEGPTRGFAMPRLEVSGRVGTDGPPLEGVAWIVHLDRLWGDLPAPEGRPPRLRPHGAGLIVGGTGTLLLSPEVAP
jgi:predicted secreted hydrolase